jgi:Fe-S cluster biosynthesis and repair protein YggX
MGASVSAIILELACRAGLAEQTGLPPETANRIEVGMAQRMVKCVKLGRELPGLDEPPWSGELGQRIYDNISEQAWDLWVEHMKMLINEFRLNPSTPEAQDLIARQMEQFFFGPGAAPPPDYIPPKH